MAYIIVLPEFGLVADPLIGIITSAGESLSPVAEKVAILEATADDLVNMLSGEGNLSHRSRTARRPLLSVAASMPSGTGLPSDYSLQESLHSS